MVECMTSLLALHDMMMGDVAKDTQCFLTQGFSEEHIKSATVAWSFLAEITVNRDLRGEGFATKSLRAG